MITNIKTGTCIDEVATGIYRICTPLDIIPGRPTFNSYLIAGDEPLLFHTGCGDLFTQTWRKYAPVTEAEVLNASEGMREMMDYDAHATSTSSTLERLASLQPSMLACQHGSAYRGDGAALLRELAATASCQHRLP